MPRTETPAPSGPLELVAIRGLGGGGGDYLYQATLCDGRTTVAVVCTAEEITSPAELAEAVAAQTGRTWRPPARTEGERWLDTVLHLLNEADRA